MTGDSTWMIAGMSGVLALGAIWGYAIGTAGKRREWSGKKIKGLAVFPLLIGGLIPLVASVVTREATGYSRTDPAWARFPWVLTMSAAFLAMLIAVKITRTGVAASRRGDDDLPAR